MDKEFMKYIPFIQFQYGGSLHEEEKLEKGAAVESINRTLSHAFVHPERIEIAEIRYEQ